MPSSTRGRRMSRGAQRRAQAAMERGGNLAGILNAQLRVGGSARDRGMQRAIIRDMRRRAYNERRRKGNGGNGG